MKYPFSHLKDKLIPIFRGGRYLSCTPPIQHTKIIMNLFPEKFY